MIRAAAVCLALSTSAMAEQTVTLLEFDDLVGWSEDDHLEALTVFQETCPDLDDPIWQPICAFAGDADDAKGFFETLFRPVLIEDGNEMLFTGYYEPELRGSLRPSARYDVPVYRLPPEAEGSRIWISREAIETTGELLDRDLEIAWVDDPVDLFFLQIQGSGRIRLPNGDYIRVGYAGSNGHQYSSIGQELVRRGVYARHEVSADVIRSWIRRNPEEGAELMRVNASYVFFRSVNEVPADMGPLGAMNRSVTTLRSLAVDPSYTPLGAPVWIERAGETPMNRLMIAQDTGSAIKGAQRADIFFGTGRAAGQDAGRVRDGGRMVVLLPIQHAHALTSDTGEL